MPVAQTCPKCGDAMAGVALGGLCPKCVAALALATEPSVHATAVTAFPLTEKPGDRIGHYKLLQQIGEGGCGVVYMAQQETPVRRQVALKIIKLGMDTRNVIARFEAERQALALMDHANIARVIDAGATETGRLTSSWSSWVASRSPTIAIRTGLQLTNGWICSFTSAERSNTRIKRALSIAT